MMRLVSHWPPFSFGHSSHSVDESATIFPLFFFMPLYAGLKSETLFGFADLSIQGQCRLPVKLHRIFLELLISIS
jgi:hypothetical protein